MSYQVDRVLDDADTAMRHLKDTMAGIPARREGFTTAHDRMAKTMAELVAGVTDSKILISD